MTLASSLRLKAFWLLLGWTGLEAEEEESPLEEDKEKVSWEPLSMSSLPSLSSSQLLPSPQAIIKLEKQVHAFASTKLQKEIYSCHDKPYFKVPSWQKMTVAVSMT
jgi:hypothetical protein